jgi:hypothetical protein
MFKQVDRSPRLARLIQGLGDFMARQRGLPVVIGIALVIVSFVVQSVNVYANNPGLELLGIAVLHLGIISALVGLLLAEALGS